MHLLLMKFLGESPHILVGVSLLDFSQIFYYNWCEVWTKEGREIDLVLFHQVLWSFNRQRLLLQSKLSLQFFLSDLFLELEVVLKVLPEHSEDSKESRKSEQYDQDIACTVCNVVLLCALIVSITIVEKDYECSDVEHTDELINRLLKVICLVLKWLASDQVPCGKYLNSHEDHQLDKSLLGEKEEDEAYNHEPVCLENVPVYAKWMIILNPKTFSQCPEPALIYFVSKVFPVFENDDLHYEWQGHKSDEQRKYKDD